MSQTMTLNDLPDDLLTCIIQYESVYEQCAARRINKRIKTLVERDMWPKRKKIKYQDLNLKTTPWNQDEDEPQIAQNRFVLSKMPNIEVTDSVIICRTYKYCEDVAYDHPKLKKITTQDSAVHMRMNKNDLARYVAEWNGVAYDHIKPEFLVKYIKIISKKNIVYGNDRDIIVKYQKGFDIPSSPNSGFYFNSSDYKLFKRSEATDNYRVKEVALTFQNENIGNDSKVFINVTKLTVSFYVDEFNILKLAELFPKVEHLYLNYCDVRLINQLAKLESLKSVFMHTIRSFSIDELLFNLEEFIRHIPKNMKILKISDIPDHSFVQRILELLATIDREVKFRSLILNFKGFRFHNGCLHVHHDYLNQFPAIKKYLHRLSVVKILMVKEQNDHLRELIGNLSNTYRNVRFAVKG